MHVIHDEEIPAWIELMREQEHRDAATFVPRPGCPIYGLAAPAPTPADLTQAEVTHHRTASDEWTSITLAYGPRDAVAGPCIAVTTAVTDPTVRSAPGGMRGSGPEAELRHAVDREHRRIGGEDAAPETVGASAGPPRLTREELPGGPALVVRQGIVWAVRPLPPEPPAAAAIAPAVTVTIVGRGAAPESVRLTPLADLRPIIEARVEGRLHRLEQRRRERRPPAADGG